MEQKKIDRINELAKLAKERELTDEEKVERAALRQEYVNSVLGDLRNQLNNTDERKGQQDQAHPVERGPQAGQVDPTFFAPAGAYAEKREDKRHGAF